MELDFVLNESVFPETKPILVANAHLSSCENRCNTSPAAHVCFLETAQKRDRCRTAEEEGNLPVSGLMLEA